MSCEMEDCFQIYLDCNLESATEIVAYDPTDVYAVMREAYYAGWKKAKQQEEALDELARLGEDLL